MLRLAATALLSLILIAPAHAAPVQFDFHSNFLLNLHSFLYNAAQRPEALRQTA